MQNVGRIQKPLGCKDGMDIVYPQAEFGGSVEAQ